jgi:hypothetical protein
MHFFGFYYYSITNDENPIPRPYFFLSDKLSFQQTNKIKYMSIRIRIVAIHK